MITPNRGLLAPSVRMTLDDLARLAKTDIDPCAEEFRKPLQQDAKALAEALGPRGQPVLLGSIATPKYVDVLLVSLSAGASFPGRIRWSGRHEPWGSLASLCGRPLGTRLRAGAGSCPARRPATKAASSGDSILNHHPDFLQEPAVFNLVLRPDSSPNPAGSSAEFDAEKIGISPVRGKNLVTFSAACGAIGM